MGTMMSTAPGGATPASASATAESPARVQIAGLSKSYAGAQGTIDAIGHVSITVRDGEVCTVVGPSGCGKSSLLRVLAGLEPVSGGVATVVPSGRRLPTATVFQGASLFPWLRVVDNVAYPLWIAGDRKRARRAAAMAALERVGLADFARSYPAQLSEGMRQRVVIARALVADAGVLLMDEPFSALDEPTRLLLQEELQDILAHTRQTVLFVTHSIDEAVVLGDRVLVLSARPATIRAEFTVPFDRPRRFADLRRDPRFGELTVAVWEVLRAEVERGRSRP